ncbi:hypothetical protein LEP1GSC040_2152 [Leptospira santarosai str. 2000030832]|nr:hypothetical protein LEP1GSC040_2152 [Leptospira santarosai str. 2000030832]
MRFRAIFSRKISVRVPTWNGLGTSSKYIQILNCRGSYDFGFLEYRRAGRTFHCKFI